MSREEALEIIIELEQRENELNLLKELMNKEIAEVMLSVNDEISRIEATYYGSITDAEMEIESITQKARQAVLFVKESIRGNRKIVVFCRGKSTWNTKKLDVLARIKPEICECKTWDPKKLDVLAKTSPEIDECKISGNDFTRIDQLAL